jgi:hypothetical protein
MPRFQNSLVPTGMGYDFSKFQKMLRFALKIFPTHNLKGFKTAEDKSRHKEQKNESSVALEFQESP